MIDSVGAQEILLIDCNEADPTASLDNNAGYDYDDKTEEITTFEECFCEDKKYCGLQEALRLPLRKPCLHPNCN